MITTVNSGNVFDIEMEKALGSAGQQKRIMWRGNASKLKTLLLYEGDSIALDFCLSSKTTVTVNGIRYSNDGVLDNVTLAMDGTYIGHFETRQFTWWGHQWNNFTDTGMIGKPQSMNPGNHVLNISVIQSDNYGVELDAISIELSPEKSNETFLCMSSIKEHVAFTRVFSVPDIDMESSEGDSRPRVIQNSKSTSCVDESNIQLCFDAQYMIGTHITALSEYLNNTGLGDAWRLLYDKAQSCHKATKEIWKIGVNNDDNAEFGESLRSQRLEFVMEAVLENNLMFPRVIYPTLTASVRLRFRVSEADLRSYPYVIFTLGTVNPDRIPVSLQYYNYLRGRMSGKDEHMLSGRNREGIWYIPTEELSSSSDNLIELTFSGAVAPLNIDYLQLEVGKRDIAYPSKGIFRNKMLDIRGVRSLSGSTTGMNVRTIFQSRPGKVEQFSIMARKGRLSNYAKILTLHSNGKVFLHTMAERMPLINDYPDNLVEVSGVTLLPHITGQNVNIKDVLIDPIQLTLKITYTDNSEAMFKVAAVSDETKMILYNISLSASASRDSFICYNSNYLSSTLAAVNGLTIDDTRRYDVMSNFNGMRGKSFWLDHEFAPWFVQVGSDMVIDFP